MRANVLLADDHGIMREGLRALLARQEGITVVGEAADGPAALELARRLRPDVVILDIGLPGLSGIAVAARITAELGTMVVSEQIDAYHSLGRDPVVILGAPRILAGLLVMPLLVGFANAMGIFSGMVAAQASLGLSYETFFYGARLFWHSWDLFYSLMKALTFGFAIPVIAIHMGFRTSGGAAGVGRTTTASVMFQTLTVLILDAMFPPLFLQ